MDKPYLCQAYPKIDLYIIIYSIGFFVTNSNFSVTKILQVKVKVQMQVKAKDWKQLLESFGGYLLTKQDTSPIKFVSSSHFVHGIFVSDSICCSLVENWISMYIGLYWFMFFGCSYPTIFSISFASHSCWFHVLFLQQFVLVSVLVVCLPCSLQVTFTALGHIV